MSFQLAYLCCFYLQQSIMCCCDCCSSMDRAIFNWYCVALLANGFLWLLNRSVLWHCWWDGQGSSLQTGHSFAKDDWRVGVWCQCPEWIALAPLFQMGWSALHLGRWQILSWILCLAYNNQQSYQSWWRAEEYVELHLWQRWDNNSQGWWGGHQCRSTSCQYHICSICDKPDARQGCWQRKL